MTEAEQLNEFIKGPCSPLTFSPGFAASALRIEINCEELQLNDKETFESCWWNTCSDKPHHFWPFYRKPSPEYDIWMPSHFSVISMFSPSSIRDKCYYNLVKILYNDSTTNMKDFIIKRPGINLTWLGNTTQTKYTTNCGLDAVNDIGKFGGLVGKTAPYRQFVETLQFLGYTSGLTMQILPYDFRPSILYNGHDKIFKRAVKRLNRVTGKRVIVSGHSYGNINIYYALTSMDQQEKDSTIKTFISIHPPFGSGLATAMKALIGGSERLKVGPIGLNFWSYMSFLSQQAVIYEGIPTDVFEIDADKYWMKNITSQIHYEEQKGEGPTEKGLRWWPDFNQTCSRNYMYHDNCSTGLFNQSAFNMMNIGQEAYKINQMRNYIIKNTFNSPKLAKKSFDLIDNYEPSRAIKVDFVNPGVPVQVMFSTKIRTEFGLVYLEDPSKHKYNERLKNPDLFRLVRGDKTVTANSALIPTQKWALEWEKEKKGKPVKFVEICSLQKQKISPYDHEEIFQSDVPKTDRLDYEPFKEYYKKFWNKKTGSLKEGIFGEKNGLEILKNDYIGLQCKSLHKGYKNTGFENEHNIAMQDKAFLHFLSNSLMTFEKSKIGNVGSEDNWFKSNEEVKQYIEQCKLLLNEN